MRHNIDRQTENVMLERASFAQDDTDDYVARARALRPLITAHAARIEQEREIAPDVLSALHDAQLFRMLVPKSCDGAEVAPAVFMQAIEELAKADGSTAWCVAQASGCSMAAAYVEPKVAREIFGDARSVMAWGPVGPDAKSRAAIGPQEAGASPAASSTRAGSAVTARSWKRMARRALVPTASRPNAPC